MEDGSCWKATSQEHDNTLGSVLTEPLKLLKIELMMVVYGSKFTVPEHKCSKSREEDWSTIQLIKA